MPDTLHTCATYAVSFRGIYGRCMCYRYHIWGHQSQPCDQEHSIHTLQTTLNAIDIYHWKHGCHIANIGHTKIILYWHTNVTLPDIYAKTQPTATFPSHVIDIQVQETNISGKLFIYVIYLLGIYGRCMIICATYEVTGITHVTSNTTHTLQILSCYWHRPFNKY